MIEIRRIADDDPFEFDVVVRQGKGTTLHHVTLSRELYERLIAGMHTPERLIEAAFRCHLRLTTRGALSRHHCREWAHGTGA